MKKPAPEARRRRQPHPFDKVTLVLLRLVLVLFWLLPMPFLRGLYHCGVHIAMPFLTRRKRIIRGNLELALGRPPSDREVRTLARRALFNLALTCTDLLRLPALRRRMLAKIRIYGLERFQAAAAKGRGVLVITGHLGSFEMLAPLFRARNIVRPALVGRKLRNPAANQLLVELRASAGVGTIHPFESARDIVRRLRDRQGIGFAIDQNQRYGGVFPQFFGKTAATTAAPAVLARISRAPVVPIFVVRDRKGRLSCHVWPAMEFERTADRKQGLLHNTARFTQAIEQAVRRWPDQWFWFHKRFRTRPRSEGGNGGRRGDDYFNSRLRRRAQLASQS